MADLGQGSIGWSARVAVHRAGRIHEDGHVEAVPMRARSVLAWWDHSADDIGQSTRATSGGP
jgi:hypothetical protein